MTSINIGFLMKHLIVPLLLCLVTAVSGHFLLDDMSYYYEITLNAIAIFLAGLQVCFFINRRVHACQILNYVIYYFSAIYFLVIMVFYATHLMVLFRYQDLVALLHRNDNYSFLMFTGICFLQPILLPLPEPFTIMAGSAVLGPWKAFLSSYVATSLGIITMFTITRMGGLRIKNRKGNEKALQRYYHYVDRYGQWVVIFLLVFPVLPDEVISLGAGLSSMRYQRFIPIILVAKLFSSYVLSFFPHLFIEL